MCKYIVIINKASTAYSMHTVPCVPTSTTCDSMIAYNCNYIKAKGVWYAQDHTWYANANEGMSRHVPRRLSHIPFSHACRRGAAITPSSLSQHNTVTNVGNITVSCRWDIRFIAQSRHNSILRHVWQKRRWNDTRRTNCLASWESKLFAWRLTMRRMRWRLSNVEHVTTLFFRVYL